MDVRESIYFDAWGYFKEGSVRGCRKEYSFPVGRQGVFKIQISFPNAAGWFQRPQKGNWQVVSAFLNVFAPTLTILYN